MERIVVIRSDAEARACADVLRAAFGTVAAEFGLTESSAPAHPAFVTAERLAECLAKRGLLFGLMEGDELIGCVSIERSRRHNDSFCIERLAVVPSQRHHGYGAMLMAFAMETIRKLGGKFASLGLMNENIVLKKWYEDQGFRITEVKKLEHLPFEVCLMSRAVDP